MSLRFRPYADGLASLLELRYAGPDVPCDANIYSREPAALVFCLFSDAQTGATQVRFRRDPVLGVSSCGKVGFTGGVLQRMVTDSSSDGAGWIRRPLVGGGAVIGRGTCVHVSDRRHQVDRASAGTGFRDGRIWEYQRHCGGQVSTC
jgi:hypothetical protein